MCGRYQFSLHEYPDLEVIVQDAQRRAGQDGKAPPMTGEVLPSSTAPVMIANGGKIVGDWQRWGIRNPYGKWMINARAETVTEKPMFRRSILAQRCVIPASGYYEWDKARHKYYFTRPDEPVFLAGIYDVVDNANCFVVLTTAPNESVSPVHDRMPLVLRREQIRPWLTDAGAALQILASAPPPLQRRCTDGQMSFSDFS